MKEIVQMSEADAIAKVKGLAKLVFFIAVLQMVVAVVFLVLLTESEISWLGGILVGTSTVLFIVGWFLFTKQSYALAVGLTIFLGINLALNVFGVISLLISGGDLGGLGGAAMSIVFFITSYNGMKAAGVLKEIRANIISPDVFS